MANIVLLEILLGLGVVVVTAVLLIAFMVWRKRLRK